MTELERAREAKRLLNDEFLAYALSCIRQEAIESLLATDPELILEVTKWQRTVAVCDALPRQLHRFMLAASLDNSNGGSIA